MANRPLTPKQILFVKHYLVSLNATDAAREAGYSDPEIGRRLITKGHVIQAISEAQVAREKRVEITQDKVLTRLWEEANNHGERSSHAARVKALSVLGEHLGLINRSRGGVAVVPIAIDWDKIAQKVAQRNPKEIIDVGETRRLQGDADVSAKPHSDSAPEGGDEEVG